MARPLRPVPPRPAAPDDRAQARTDRTELRECTHRRDRRGRIGRTARGAAVLLLAALAACAPLPPAPLAPTAPSAPPASPSGAPAADREGPVWQALAPGLDRWQGAPGLQALRVDLRQRRLQLSAFTERGQALDGFAGARDALAAVNASFFDRSFRARGHTVSAGAAWPEPLSPEDSPLLHCADDATPAPRCALQLQPPYTLPERTALAVAGTPWLLRGGVARSSQDDARCPGLCAARHPRTALGLSADRHTLYLLLVEGRSEGRPGLTLAQTAAQLQALGAHEALNLDGGGSSSLLLNGVSSMARPANEPALRRIANALLVR